MGQRGGGAGLSRGAFGAMQMDGPLPMRLDEGESQVGRMGKRECSDTATSLDLGLVKAGGGVLVWPGVCAAGFALSSTL